MGASAMPLSNIACVSPAGGGQALLPGQPQRPLSPFHLRQRRLRLREPEGHVHRTIKRDGRRQCRAGLLPLTRLGVQCPEAALTVGLEGRMPSVSASASAW